jgi:hypothetical protein
MKYAQRAILSIATVLCLSSNAWAQKLQVEPVKPAEQAAPAATPAEAGGIKSQSIFEVKPDANLITRSRAMPSATRFSPATMRPCGGKSDRALQA